MFVASTEKQFQRASNHNTLRRFVDCAITEKQFQRASNHNDTAISPRQKPVYSIVCLIVNSVPSWTGVVAVKDPARRTAPCSQCSAPRHPRPAPSRHPPAPPRPPSGRTDFVRTVISLPRRARRPASASPARAGFTKASTRSRNAVRLPGVSRMTST